jgi:hypothetical protein
MTCVMPKSRSCSTSAHVVIMLPKARRLATKKTFTGQHLGVCKSFVLLTPKMQTYDA